MNNLTTQAGPEETRRIVATFSKWLTTPIASKTERDAISEQITSLTQPPKPKYVIGRVAALLSGYYVADVPESIRNIEIEDWSTSLNEFPEWAIAAACRWWTSEHNDSRRYRPQIGDIVKQARREMGGVDVARMAIRRFDRGVRPEVEEQRTPPTPEQIEQRRAYAESVLGKGKKA